ncbi:tetratricopeptide repeat protein [Nocardia cyriacigeorgica]|nr:tetratricopeptide repeat protein [Nocardia cyriacigeorgica]
MERAGRSASSRATGIVSAEERRRLRNRLAELGLTRHQLIELLAGELRQRGFRPRAAWRYANELTQTAVADRYNEITGSANAAMKASRISEYEAWPFAKDGAGVRPTIRALKTLATIYGTTWDQLVDIADLEQMPLTERLEFQEAVARRGTDDVPVRTGGDLPAEVPNFTGRNSSKAQLRQRVEDHLYGDGPAVHVIDGLTGIGKTALARYAVAAFGRRFPDGTLWVDLHGYTAGREPRDPGDVLEQLLLEVGVPREIIEADPGGRAVRWRSAMSGQRMMIVFDNVLDSAQVKPLLPQAPGCFVIITSRSKLTGLAEAAPLRLEVMEWAEAEELLVKLGNLGSAYDRASVRQILRTSGRLPLAIKLIGGQIAHHGADMLADVAAEFATLTADIKNTHAGRSAGSSAAEDILDRFAAEDESLRAAFEMSYQRLASSAHQRAVRLLGWFPGPEVTAETMATIAAVPLNEGKLLVRRLFEAGFLDPAPSGPTGPRYRMHDLTRLCARLHAEREDSPREHAAVLERLIAHGLTIAWRASRLDVFDPAGSEHLSDPSDEANRARAWLTAEGDMLFSCVQAAPPGADVSELARLLAAHLSGSGQWSRAHRLYERAYEIADILDDRRGQAWALLGRGRIDRLVGNHAQARSTFRAAEAIAVELGYLRCHADVLCELGQTARITGDHAGARTHFTDALAIARQLGHRPSECDALDGLAHVERAASDYQTARECSERALEIANEMGDPVRVAAVQWGYAEVIRRMGDHRLAGRHYSDALGIARSLNHRKLEGDALRGLGHIERLVGDLDTARGYFDDALDIARHIHDRYGEGWTLWGLGNIARKTGEYERAREMFQQAHDIAEAINDPLGQVDALRGLGHVQRHFGDYEAARRYYTDSMAVAERIGDPHGLADGLRGLAHVAARTSTDGSAEELLARALEQYERIGVTLAEQVRAEMLRDN